MRTTALYDNVVRRCKTAGVTVYKLEKDLGFAASTIARWDGKDPRVGNVKKVADYFGCTIQDLLQEDGHNDS